MAAVTLEERVAREAEIKARLAEIDAEHAGDALPDEVRSEWNDLNLEREEVKKVIEELRERSARLEELKDATEARDEPKRVYTSSRRSDTEIHDMFEIRKMSNSPDHERELLRDNAMRAVDRAVFELPPYGRNREDVQGGIERMMENDAHGEISRRILSTGSPAYKRAFAKVIADKPLTTEEQRAMSTTGSAGGYAVPFALDPTIIMISNYSVNPYRAICRNVQITGANTWEGVSMAGITAAYQVEAGTATDNTPTFAQPSAVVQKAQAFVPFSFEIEGDFNGNFMADLTQGFADARDDLEAVQFTTGTGTAPAPVGILGAQGLTTSQRQQTATTAVLAVADIDATQNTLPPRWRSRAVWVGNLGFYQRVRRFYTAGGETLTAGVGPGNSNGFSSIAPGGGTVGYDLLGRPAYECTGINTTNVTTSGTTQAIFGDFSRGMVIVDRVGMNVEVVRNLFGASGYPNGQRGLLAWWRNNTAITNKGSFVYLATL